MSWSIRVGDEVVSFSSGDPDVRLFLTHWPRPSAKAPTGRALTRDGKFEKVEPGVIQSDQAGVPLSPNDAQRLVERLWELGYRPRQAKATAGTTAAMQDHTDDLRREAQRAWSTIERLVDRIVVHAQADAKASEEVEVEAEIEAEVQPPPISAPPEKKPGRISPF